MGITSCKTGTSEMSGERGYRNARTNACHSPSLTFQAAQTPETSKALSGKPSPNGKPQRKQLSLIFLLILFHFFCYYFRFENPSLPKAACLYKLPHSHEKIIKKIELFADGKIFCQKFPGHLSISCQRSEGL